MHKYSNTTKEILHFLDRLLKTQSDLVFYPSASDHRWPPAPVRRECTFWPSGRAGLAEAPPASCPALPFPALHWAPATLASLFLDVSGCFPFALLLL